MWASPCPRVTLTLCLPWSGLPPAEPIPEYTAREEINDERAWRSCVVAGLERRIDMKVIEPYKKVRQG